LNSFSFDFSGGNFALRQISGGDGASVFRNGEKRAQEEKIKFLKNLCIHVTKRPLPAFK
jgi:hypothetical protein